MSDFGADDVAGNAKELVHGLDVPERGGSERVQLRTQLDGGGRGIERKCAYACDFCVLIRDASSFLQTKKTETEA